MFYIKRSRKLESTAFSPQPKNGDVKKMYFEYVELVTEMGSENELENSPENDPKKLLEIVLENEAENEPVLCVPEIPNLEWKLFRFL